MLVNKAFQLILHSQSQWEHMKNSRVCLLIIISRWIIKDCKGHLPGAESRLGLRDHWRPLLIVNNAV